MYEEIAILEARNAIMVEEGGKAILACMPKSIEEDWGKDGAIQISEHLAKKCLEAANKIEIRHEELYR